MIAVKVGAFLKSSLRDLAELFQLDAKLGYFSGNIGRRGT